MAMNRKERRDMKHKLAPVARKVATLELQIKRGENVAEAEAEIEQLISQLTLIEMIALEDYITSKGFLDTK